MNQSHCGYTKKLLTCYKGITPYSPERKTEDTCFHSKQIQQIIRPQHLDLNLYVC